MMKVDASKNVIGADHLADKSYIGTIWVKLDLEDRALLERVSGQLDNPYPQPTFLGRCLICGKDTWGRHVECEQRGKEAIGVLKDLEDNHTNVCPICKYPLHPGSSVKVHMEGCRLAALLREVAE